MLLCQWIGDDAHRPAVDALLAGALHGAQVATDGLLRDASRFAMSTTSTRPFGGQQVTDRLEASRSLCVLAGGYRLRMMRRANVTGTPSYALTECLQRTFESLLLRRLAQLRQLVQCRSLSPVDQVCPFACRRSLRPAFGHSCEDGARKAAMTMYPPERQRAIIELLIQRDGRRASA